MPLLCNAAVVDFDELPLGPDSFYNGDPGGLGDGASNDGTFTSGGATFNNTFTNFGGGFTGWTGWSYSNVTDTTTPGPGNQYAAYQLPGGGGDRSENYGVAFTDAATIALPAGQSPVSLRITNTTYAALSIRDGDSFSKKFGGDSGNDEDFFRVDITGRSGGVTGSITGTIPFYLADYRFSDNGLDYIVDAWTSVDLTSLAGADTLTFEFASSDVGGFGINTPTYFALDSLVTHVPEPSTGILISALVVCFLFGRNRYRRWRTSHDAR